MRFDGHKYVDCRWCGGSGCLQCETEASKAYEAAFPEGPQPIATFRADNPDDVKRFRSIFGADALKKTFGPDGGGTAEIYRKLRGDTDPSNA